MTDVFFKFFLKKSILRKEGNPQQAGENAAVGFLAGLQLLTALKTTEISGS
jgi:hypothetical protein